MIDDIFTQLAEDYGVETIMLQNDIAPEDLLERMYAWGMFDVEDYIFTELEIGEED